jgi:hypothetical protein
MHFAPEISAAIGVRAGRRIIQFGLNHFFAAADPLSIAQYRPCDMKGPEYDTLFECPTV